METRSNWLKVSLVVGLLIAAVIGFTLWLIQSREADGATYEVQFKHHARSASEFVPQLNKSFLGIF